MVKFRIKQIGHIPYKLDLKKIKAVQSEIIEVEGDIETYNFNDDAEGEDWEFTDDQFLNLINNFEEGITLVLTNVPLEENYYSRRIGSNIAVITFYEMNQILTEDNIPLENLVFREMYEYALIYLENEKLPSVYETYVNSFTHDDTRGCIFDMTGIKEEIVYSCVSPKLCNSCMEKLRTKNISNEKIDRVNKELKRLRKKLFYRIIDFTKVHPLLSLLASSIYAIILGFIGSMVYGFIFRG